MNRLNKTFYDNKVVVITGGAGGLGQAIFSQLNKYNAKVAILDLNVDAIKKTEQTLPIQVDITDVDALALSIKEIIDTFFTIDILINNAGITHISCFKDLPASLFNTIMNVNFTASVNMTRLCLPYIEESAQGRIVAISSVAGFAPLYGRSAYSASKHAMEGFFYSLSSELEDTNTSVLVVSPAFVKSRPELITNVNDGITSPGAMKKNTKGKELSPQVAADKILTATSTKQHSLYLGTIAKIARWLYALLPSIYIQIMSKQAKEEFK